MISTPFIAVPPPKYGGTELIVAELIDGLSSAGHEVTLFGTGDSQTRAEQRWLFPVGKWPPDAATERDHAAWAAAEIARDPRPFDVVHSHVASVLAFARFLRAPLAYTIHHDRDERMAQLYAGERAQFIAISARQRELCPEAAGAEVIHHGLSPERYPFGRGGGGLVYLGRCAREKGVHVALDLARAARLPITLAGRPHWRDQTYFEQEIEPRLLRPGARLIGEVGGRDKARLLGGALALLFPIDWEEPFGLVMIEAMLCGTPVVALARGSVPEVIDPGVTGFVCADDREMLSRLRQIAAGRFDRRRCRARALERWSARRMVLEHLALYEKLRQEVAWERSDERSALPSA